MHSHHFHLKYVKLGIEKDLEKHSKRDYSDYRSWVWRNKSKGWRDRDGDGSFLEGLKHNLITGWRYRVGQIHGATLRLLIWPPNLSI